MQGNQVHEAHKLGQVGLVYIQMESYINIQYGLIIY